MKVEVLKANQIRSFIDFCKKHRDKLDDSNLYDEDLEGFTLDDENPTYIITNENQEIVAASSLIIGEYNRQGKRARFRIFYSEIDNMECYKVLLSEILKHCDGLNKIFLYILINNNTLMEAFHNLRFSIERYSYVLVRDNDDIPEVELPEDYKIRSFIKGKDEETWRDIRNIAFAKLQGSETPITKEAVEKMLEQKDHIEGGMKILFHLDKPIGVVRGSNDIDEGEPILYIGPVAIVPEYQGKGLGRSILRDIIHFGKSRGYKKSILSVNAENENANKLYISEGFKQIQAVACFIYKL